MDPRAGREPRAGDLRHTNTSPSPKPAPRHRKGPPGRCAPRRSGNAAIIPLSPSRMSSFHPAPWPAGNGPRGTTDHARKSACGGAIRIKGGVGPIVRRGRRAVFGPTARATGHSRAMPDALWRIRAPASRHEAIARSRTAPAFREFDRPVQLFPVPSGTPLRASPPAVGAHDPGIGVVGHALFSVCLVRQSGIRLCALLVSAPRKVQYGLPVRTCPAPRGYLAWNEGMVVQRRGRHTDHRSRERVCSLDVKLRLFAGGRRHSRHTRYTARDVAGTRPVAPRRSLNRRRSHSNHHSEFARYTNPRPESRPLFRRTPRCRIHRTSRKVTRKPWLATRRISRSGDTGGRIVPEEPHPVRLSQSPRLASAIPRDLLKSPRHVGDTGDSPN